MANIKSAKKRIKIINKKTVPLLNAIPLEGFFAPVLVLAYGVKTLTEK